MGNDHEQTNPAPQTALPAPRGRAAKRVLACLAIGVLLVLFHFAMKHGQALRDKRERGADAYVVSMLLVESLRNNGGVYPPWDPRPGHLFFDRAAMNPTFRLAHPLNRTPGAPETALVVGQINNQLGFILDSFPEETQYIYLSHAVTNEHEGLALLDAYRTAVQTQGSFQDSLPAGPGGGTCGADQFYRLRNDLQQKLAEDSVTIPDGMNLSQRVPVLFERPHGEKDKGAWVVPMNRRPVWVRYPGPFPMTERFIEAIEALEAEFKPSEQHVTSPP
jgi:hypothetical protein